MILKMFKGIHALRDETYQRLRRLSSMNFAFWKSIWSSTIKDNVSMIPKKLSSRSPVILASERSGMYDLWLKCNLCFSKIGCEMPVFRDCTQESFKSARGGKVLISRLGITGRCVENSLTTKSLSNMQVRFKSQSKKTDKEDTLSDSDDDSMLEEDDFDAPLKFKLMKITVSSLRADGIISSALDIARNRLEEEFLGSGLLLNGNKMLKKSVKMEAGDYVDLVVEKIEGKVKVKRVKVVKVYPEKTSKDKFIVKVRVWKSPFLVSKHNA